MTIKTSKNYWKSRAENYDDKQRTKNKSVLKSILSIGKFNKNDIVLDVGSGTGIISNLVANKVKQVVGIDKSSDMIFKCKPMNNILYINNDILNDIFIENSFDKITCRYVFHYIVSKQQKAMDICYKTLKKGGTIIIVEGVPPSKRVKSDFKNIFKNKLDRVVCYDDDLVKLMKRSGFKNIKVKNITIKKFSIKKWLKNHVLSQKEKDRIYNLHVNAKDYFKKDYNMVVTDNDCFIDLKISIITGKK